MFSQKFGTVNLLPSTCNVRSRGLLNAFWNHAEPQREETLSKIHLIVIEGNVRGYVRIHPLVFETGRLTRLKTVDPL